MLRKALNIIGTMILLLLIAAVLPLTLPKLFGYRLYHILTPSMEPAIWMDSTVYVRSVDPEELQEGDVIVFQIAGGLDTMETHRIVHVDKDRQMFTTKGDANFTEDQNPVLFSSVMGKVVFHIPLYGLLADWLHSPRGIAVCTALFAAVLLMYEAADRIEPRGKNE